MMTTSVYLPSPASEGDPPVRKSGSPPTIVAAVMTYNRCDSVRRCLEGIRAQTVAPTKILVIDNASTDETAQMLSREFPEAQVYRTAENVGCAGAMHEALRLALTLTPEYIWFFDDDVVPFPRCLEVLLREMRILEEERRIGFLRPMIQDPKTGDVAGGGVSHGALLRAEMVTRVGLPFSELFIELSDVTYNLQIRRAGYEILRLPVVLARHPVDRPKALSEIVAQGYRAKPWRLYYAIRNRVYFSLYMQPSPRQFVRNLGMAARMLALLSLFGRPRRGQLFVMRGLIDGLRGRLGRRVEPGY